MKRAIFISSMALLFPSAAQSNTADCSQYKLMSEQASELYSEYTEKAQKAQFLENDHQTAETYFDMADFRLLQASQWATLYIAFCKE